MKPLPETFRQGGFDFRILWRRGRVALLVKRKPRQKSESFEVVLIQERAEEKICGHDYLARETMPKSESWGTEGFTFTTRADAESRFERLATRREKCQARVKGFAAARFHTPGKVRTADNSTKARHGQIREEIST